MKMTRSMKGHQMSVKTEGNWHPASRRAGGAGGHLLTILQIVPFDQLPQLYQSRLTALPQVSSMQSLSVPVHVPCAVLWRACLTHPVSAQCHFRPNVKTIAFTLHLHLLCFRGDANSLPSAFRFLFFSCSWQSCADQSLLCDPWLPHSSSHSRDLWSRVYCYSWAGTKLVSFNSVVYLCILTHS